MKSSWFAIMLGLALPVCGFSSGYICESGDGVRVRLYHYNHPSKGTRNPAAFVLSTAAEGTLLVARGSSITRVNLKEVVQYHVDANAEIESDELVLEVRYKEGIDERAPKTNLPGKLMMVTAEEVTSEIPLTCTRFIKGNA